MSEQTFQETSVVRPVGSRWMRGLVFLATAALASVLLAGLAWLLQTPTHQIVRSPDGRVLRLAGITFGREHLYVDGPRWQQFLLPLVGLRRAREWKWSAEVASYARPTVVCWMTGFNPASGSNGWGPPSILRVSNEAGAMVPVDVEHDVVNATSGAIRAVPLVQYPRRGRWLHLEFYRLEMDPKLLPTRMARFVIPNPVSGQYPQWQPRPIPQRVDVGSIAFLLKQFQTGVIYPGEFRDPQGLKRPDDPLSASTALNFEVQTKGVVDPDWQIAAADLSNATGDSWPECAWRLDNSSNVVWVSGSFGSQEKAWKINAYFGRIRNFPTAETWAFRGLTVPTSRIDQPLNLLATHGKTRIRLRSTHADPPTPKSRRVNWIVQVSPQPARVILAIAAATDEKGRDLMRVGRNREESVKNRLMPTRGVTMVSLDVPPSTRRVNLTLALQRAQKVTFLAAPEIAKRSN